MRLSIPHLPSCFRTALFVSLLSFSNGCAPTLASNAADYQEGIHQARGLIRKFGQIRSPVTDDYLSYMKRRLVQSLPANAHLQTDYEIVLIDALEPLALSPGGGFTIISKGLVRTMSSEAEFAFVLAHELAHQVLGHTRLFLVEYGSQDFPERQRDLELAADRYAAGLIALAGYDPRVAPYALVHAYRAAYVPGGSTSYPALDTRIDALNKAVEESGWSGPGTIDRRNFRVFMSALP